MQKKSIRVTDGTTTIDANLLSVPTASLTSGSNTVNLSTVFVVSARAVVPSSAATVSPALTDSGKQYRLTNASATFRLPTGGTPGSTVYYVEGVGGQWTIDGATSSQTIEWVGSESGVLLGHTTSNIDQMLQYSMCELRCVATDTWAMTGTIALFS